MERMAEFESAHRSESEVETLDGLSEIIVRRLENFELAGLNMQKWNDEYENLPNQLDAVRTFHKKLEDFNERREAALSSLEFSESLTEVEKEKVRLSERQVIASFKNPQGFLGNGATAEVYAITDLEDVCAKFVTNQDRYNENNHFRHEFEFLSRVYEATKGNSVNTPHPFFLRIHPKEGHSYGMEKIDGANLSQILEFPEKYPELIALAQHIDRQQMEEELLDFLEVMHDTVGVSHGDLYKRNLMLAREGRLCVIDFGKARDIRMDEERRGERKISDVKTAQHALRDFFKQVDDLTK